MRRLTHGARLAHWLFALALATVAASGVARADSGSGFAAWQYSAGVLLDQYADGTPARWSAALGAGAEISPRYDGARDARFTAYPLGEIRYRDIAYASLSEGLGWNLLHRENQRAGIALNWESGRRSAHIADTRGIDTIRPGPVADLYAEQVWLPLVLRADLQHSALRDTGFRAELGAYAALPLGDSFVLFAGPSVLFVDAAAARTRYGVSTADAARSGFAPYHAGAGLEATRLGLNAVWLVDAHWNVEALATWTHLYGAAADSPLTRRRDSAAFGLALGYSF